MFVAMIDNIYLESKGVAIIRDRAGWQLCTVVNNMDKRQTFKQLSTTGDLGEDMKLYDYVRQPAKVIEQRDACGNQILNIYMRWEL